MHHYDLLKKICPELETCAKGELKAKALPDLKHVIVAESGLTGVAYNPTHYKGTYRFRDIEKHDKPLQTLPYVDMDDVFTLLFTVSDVAAC